MFTHCSQCQEPLPLSAARRPALRAANSNGVPDRLAAQCIPCTAQGSREVRTALLIEAWDRFKTIRSDNGAEFVCGDVRQWAKARGSRWHYIEPGKPTQNSHIESGSGKLRDECLNRNLWRDIAEVRRETEQYKTEHNTEHPYQALRYLTPPSYDRKLQTADESAREECPSHAMQTP